MSGSYTFNTWACIKGKEPHVKVHYFVQDAERDTNTPRGVELEAITDMAGNDLMIRMTADEIEAVVQRLDDEVRGYGY